MYKSFDKLRAYVEDECDHLSNLGKIKALANSGGVDGIPQWVLDAQRTDHSSTGEIHCMKVVGAFVPNDSFLAEDACVAALTAVFEERLRFLNEVDIMEGLEGEADTIHMEPARSAPSFNLYHFPTLYPQLQPQRQLPLLRVLRWAAGGPPVQTSPLARTTAGCPTSVL